MAHATLLSKQEGNGPIDKQPRSLKLKDKIHGLQRSHCLKIGCSLRTVGWTYSGHPIQILSNVCSTPKFIQYLSRVCPENNSLVQLLSNQSPELVQNTISWTKPGQPVQNSVIRKCLDNLWIFQATVSSK